MEVPHLIHGELLDSLQELHLAQTISRSARVEARSESIKTSPAKATEATALIAPFEDTTILDMAQAEEVLETDLTDAKLETWAIVRAESTAMVGIAVPMFLFVLLEVIPSVVMAMMVGFTDKDRSTQILAGFNLENVIEALLVNGMLGGFVAGVDTLCT